MSVGGITRSQPISINDDDDEEQQELEDELYASALQSSLGINSDDPNSPDADPNDPSTIGSSGPATVNPAAAQGTGEVARPAQELVKAQFSSSDRVSEPAPARSQATQKVIGMRSGADPMLAVYQMESQREAEPQLNVVKSKDDVG